MKGLFVILVFLTIVACDNKKSINQPRHSNIKEPEIEQKTEKEAPKTSHFDRLKNHFELYRLKPSLEITNLDGNQTEVHLGNYKIKWINTNAETKIKIDRDLFTLKGQATINLVWGAHDSVDFVNNWDEIKLFILNDREYIGIKMSFTPCTGLACGVNYFLIYDVKSGTKNFFGTFRADNELALFNFQNDNRIDYLSKSFEGDANGATPMEFLYELYSINIDGEFIPHKDEDGKVYQIKQKTFPNTPTQSDQLTYNWLVKIR